MKKNLFISLLFLLGGVLALNAQCPGPGVSCNGAYSGVTICEVSGDSGQSDGCDDGIVEICGTPGADIGCMVVSNSEWAVVIPTGTTIPADGVFLIGCSASSTTDCSGGVGINNGTGGLVADGTEGDFNSGLLAEFDFDVCGATAPNGGAIGDYYWPAASGFTIDNTGATDGDQVVLFQPDGTVHDAIAWGFPGASGNADNCTTSFYGMPYTLGDNDGNGVINDNAAAIPGGRCDGANSTGVALMPPGDCGADMVCYTMPPTSDPVYAIPASATYKGCNSSYIRLDDGTSQGGVNGSPSHADGSYIDQPVDANGNPTAIGTTTMENFSPGSYTNSACGDATAEWAYTDHPTPGLPNDEPTFAFYVDNAVQCGAGDVTFTVEVYNYQNVSDNTDILSGVDNEQLGSLVDDPVAGGQMPWQTYVVSGETTTMTYTQTIPGPGTYTFELVWDDFSNCCGSSSSFGNECYESQEIIVTVEEDITGAMINPCDGSGVLSVATATGTNITYTLVKDGVETISNTSGTFSGIIDDADPDPVYEVIVSNNCSSFTLPVDASCFGLPPCPMFDYNCITPGGPICPGSEIEMVVTVQNVPAGSNINFYADSSATFDPYAGEGTLLTQITTPVATSVMVNEVLFNPVGTDGGANNAEWVEIFAPAGTDIGCWKISDGDYTVVFPPGTTIPPSGFLTIGTGGVAEGICGIVTPTIDLQTCGCLTGSFVNNNSEEGVYLFDDTDTFVNGLAWGAAGSAGHNNGATLAYNAVGSCVAGSVTLPANGDANIVYAPTSESNGGSVGHNPDGSGTTQTFEGQPSNADCPLDLPTSFGGPNALTATFTFEAGYCNFGPAGDIFVLGSIEGLDLTNCPASCANGDMTCDDACTPLAFNMSCPEADLVPLAVDVCVADQPSVDIVVNVTSGTGPFTLEYAIDGVAQTALTGFASGDVITITGPTDEVKVSLVSVLDEGGAMCMGTVDADEACVTIRDTPTATVTAATDATVCAPACDGTVAFEFTGTGPWEFDYTIDGTLYSSLAASSPFVLMNACAGMYDIASVTDDAGCSGMITSNPQTVAPPPAAVDLTITPLAPVCGDGSVTVDLTTDVTYTPAYSAADFTFFTVDPNILPVSALGNTPPLLTPASVVPDAAVATTTTVYVQYIDPATGCPSVTPLDIVADATLCTFDLALTKGVNTTITPGPFAPGDPVTYTICVYNQGVIDATMTQVTDYGANSTTNAATDLVFVGLGVPPATTTQGSAVSVTQVAGPVFEIDVLAAGEDVCFDVDYTIDASFAGTSITNDAEITMDSGDDGDSTPGDNSTDPPDPNDDSTDDGNMDPMVQDPSDDDYDPASIVVGQPCPDPSFTCNANVDLCGGEVMLNALDLGTNGTAVTDGTWSGTGAALVVDQGTPAVADDVLDPSLGLDGVTYTLTLTMDNNGCMETFDCTFTVESTCDADGGKFDDEE